jgi:hypothetical protein
MQEARQCVCLVDKIGAIFLTENRNSGEKTKQIDGKTIILERKLMKDSFR